MSAVGGVADAQLRGLADPATNTVNCGDDFGLPRLGIAGRIASSGIIEGAFRNHPPWTQPPTDTASDAN